MKFVYLTDNYRVNLDNIFSLEQRVVNNPEYERWINDYAIAWDNICSHGIHNESYDIDFNNNISKEHEALVNDVINSMIGDAPNEQIIECHIILSTGLDIVIAKDKFDKINDAITSYMK